MEIVLWIVGGLLAAVFLAAGLMKITQPKGKLESSQGWVEDFSPGAVKAIGVVEVLGALGLILPAVTGIAPILVPVAATGLALLMVVQ
ncbi:DoxX family protein [Arthrobacter sp. JZ12]|uniref:DoxX family protein n=1 Tax=Arthrobacter sp. JZ12 TaxID=2654190 RepID=UPI002B4707A5|nr:DoxX family protein [Arthrobacter sp. JZ12]